MLCGDKPMSWTLDHSYTKFMLCPCVQERIKAGVGLQFNLHLEDVHSSMRKSINAMNLEPSSNRKSIDAMNLESSSMRKSINALNLEPSSMRQSINALNLNRRFSSRGRRHLGSHGNINSDFRADLARLDEKLKGMVISRSVEALHCALDKEQKAEQRTLHPGTVSSAPSVE